MTDLMPIELTAPRGYVGDASLPFARAPGRSIGRLLGLVTLSSIALLAADAGRELRAEAPKARIVGLGAATCRQFNDDVKTNPLIRRDYLAWAQGFMSGILLSRPAGVDEGLDLNPPSFGLIVQLHFMEDQCAKSPSLDFSDAVAALYKRLRQEGKM
ncbi:MAG: hypothetical protein E6614_34085 [Bradyrhizobium sp.]|uniref:hypothetical protein n=1 Tax=Bradyrhizobium TaxID=374 RepID=UPI001FCF06A4|nr:MULTISPECIES: hypothetical protein [Bradyrhizobium]MDU0954804.1 hypothetical protein [Bradyrhizobium sp.]MDU1498026.1 hypothetical protein [Bradyrhizobium sp.]MDU1548277.1 hypothetical protein [Bradyrhizobium sp.]MDU1693627.1 hypothetical protein [Bradyrhizobium sp.]MDU1807732.1 hypothetical protein [Bradyrhizobium sp.]